MRTVGRAELLECRHIQKIEQGAAAVRAAVVTTHKDIAISCPAIAHPGCAQSTRHSRDLLARSGFGIPQRHAGKIVGDEQPARRVPQQGEDSLRVIECGDQVACMRIPYLNLLPSQWRVGRIAVTSVPACRRCQERAAGLPRQNRRTFFQFVQNMHQISS